MAAPKPDGALPAGAPNADGNPGALGAGVPKADLNPGAALPCPWAALPNPDMLVRVW